MTFRISRFDLEDDEKDPCISENRLRDPLNPSPILRHRQSILFSSTVVPPRESQLSSPTRERLSCIATRTVSILPVTGPKPALKSLSYSENIIVNPINIRDRGSRLFAIFHAITFCVAPSQTRKVNLSIETEESNLLSPNFKDDEGVNDVAAILVDAVEVHESPMIESPFRLPPLESIHDSGVIVDSLLVTKISNEVASELESCISFQSDFQVQTFESLQVSPSTDSPKLDESHVFASTLSEIMGHPKCPEFIRRIVHSRHATIFQDPIMEDPIECSLGSVVYPQDVKKGMRRSATSIDVKAELTSPVIIKSILVPDYPEPPISSTFTTFKAVSALVKFQRRVRRRFESQKQQLLNSLGLY